MSIEYKSGDMFQEQTEAIVNTVNCVGVMGKGIALEFKKRWPKNYKAYKALCDEKLLTTGQMFVYDNGQLFDDFAQRYLINFPTKKHWRSKSKLSYVEEGLDSFAAEIRDLNIKSVSLPPLGCGNGGLEWSDVRALIERKLTDLRDVKFVVFLPEAEMNKPEHETAPTKMTAPRASLIKTIGDFETYFGGHLTRLSVQKIAYFLQILGVDFKLNFIKNEFGPYSEELHNALKNMENNSYIAGYTYNNPEITASQGAYAAAEEYLNETNNNNYIDAIKSLSNLIEGYESPFGMELLASVHFLNNKKRIRTTNEFLHEFSVWNNHKKNSFGEHEINSAINRLSEDGLMQ